MLIGNPKKKEINKNLREEEGKRLSGHIEQMKDSGFVPMVYSFLFQRTSSQRIQGDNMKSKFHKQTRGDKFSVLCFFVLKRDGLSSNLTLLLSHHLEIKSSCLPLFVLC